MNPLGVDPADWAADLTENKQRTLATGAASGDAPSSAAPRDDPPIWRWEDVFPGGIAGSAFQRLHASFLDELSALQGQYSDVLGVDGTPVAAEAAGMFDAIVTSTCHVMAAGRLLSLYLAAMCWERTDDTAASARYARWLQDASPLAALVVRLEAWTAKLAEADLIGGPVATAHAHWIRRCVDADPHRIPQRDAEMEAAAAGTGRRAWERLYADLCGALNVNLEGAVVSVGTARRDLRHPAADRRAAADAALGRAWHSLSVPAAACLNAIKADDLRAVMAANWDDPMHRSLALHDVDAAVYRAMQPALAGAREVLHRFAQAKAAAMGRPCLAWSDLSAPLPGERALSWTEATNLVLDRFAAHHPKLADHTHKAIAAGWIHAAATPTKRPTALCLPLSDGTSRLLMTFDGSLEASLSLAHELGHSYHYRLLGQCTELQRRSPLTMLEIPSMIGELLMMRPRQAPAAAQQNQSSHAQPGLVAALLNAGLRRAFQVLVGGHARLMFEHALLARRQEGPLTPEQLHAQMLQAQIRAHGDSVEPASLPDHEWISHPHLYTSTLNSWPYAFALLLSLALTDVVSNDFANLDAASEGIDPDRIDHFLARTGMASPVDLARQLNLDLTEEAVWWRAARALSAHVDVFTVLTDRSTGGSLRPNYAD